MWLSAVAGMAGFAMTIISNEFLDPLSIVGFVLVLGAGSIFDRAKAASEAETQRTEQCPRGLSSHRSLSPQLAAWSGREL